MCEVTERNAKKFILLPTETLNSADTNSMLIRVNEKFIDTINKAKTLLTLMDTSEIAIQLDEIESDVIVLSNKFSEMEISDSELEVVQNLHKQLKDSAGIETVVEFTDKMFNILQETHTVNWVEHLRFVLTTHGLYLTDRFETDYVESIMLDYSDIE